MKLWCGNEVSSNTESIIADDMSLKQATICQIFCVRFSVDVGGTLG
ncbi:hypothetical protein O9993_23210 [Vibrio lentus]|nr:hypothetical protein [Vibrio lentus]